MSFSFNVKGRSASDVQTAAEMELDKVVDAQPVHERDAANVMETVRGLVALVGDVPEGKQIDLSVCGSIWVDNDQVRTASVSVSFVINPVPAEASED